MYQAPSKCLNKWIKNWIKMSVFVPAQGIKTGGGGGGAGGGGGGQKMAKFCPRSHGLLNREIHDVVV